VLTLGNRFQERSDNRRRFLQPHAGGPKTARQQDKEKGHLQTSALSWRAYCMTVAEAMTIAYLPDFIDTFRADEKAAAVDHSEGQLLWNVLCECKQETCCLFANSQQKAIDLCTGTTGLSCPSNYFISRVQRSKVFIPTDSFYGLKKTVGNNNCLQALQQLGAIHHSYPDWTMSVHGGAVLKDLIKTVKEWLRNNSSTNTTIVVGWSATDFTKVQKGTYPAEVFAEYNELCMLLTSCPRAVLLLIGSSHEWKLEDTWDQYMEVCRDEARMYGIITHDMLTIIPSLTRSTNAWGVDPWHFVSNNDNKAMQAKAIYDLLICCELLRPSVIEFGPTQSHSWDCPNARVICQCGQMLFNHNWDKRDHHSVCEIIRHIPLASVNFQFGENMACWSDRHCIKCNCSFTPLCEREAIDAPVIVIEEVDEEMPQTVRPPTPTVTSQTGALTSQSTVQGAAVVLTSQSTDTQAASALTLQSAAHDTSAAASSSTPAVDVSMPIAYNIDVVPITEPTIVNTSPLTWLAEGKKVALETIQTCARLLAAGTNLFRKVRKLIGSLR
jgi:hypothetical protein